MRKGRVKQQGEDEAILHKSDNMDELGVGVSSCSFLLLPSSR